MTNQTESKKITAKFTGRCTNCNGVIPSGTQCFWSKAAGVSHIACPAKPTAKLVDYQHACDHAIGEDNSAVAQVPVVEKDDKQVTVTAGVFKKDGRIYVVKPNKERTRVYAKEIVESPARMTENGAVADFTTVYRAGVVFQLTEADRWNLADAKDFLTKFSKCIVCGRHLKAAKSVAGSIGPVCAKYFAHSHSCDDKPVTKLATLLAQERSVTTTSAELAEAREIDQQINEMRERAAFINEREQDNYASECDREARADYGTD